MTENANGAKPDSEKSTEELQREVLMAQKRKLEEEAETKRKREARKVPAIIAAIVIVIAAFAIYEHWQDQKEYEENVERIKDALLSDSMPESEMFLETLPLIGE